MVRVMEQQGRWDCTGSGDGETQGQDECVMEKLRTTGRHGTMDIMKREVVLDEQSCWAFSSDISHKNFVSQIGCQESI